MPCEVQNLSNSVEVHSPRGQAMDATIKMPYVTQC